MNKRPYTSFWLTMSLFLGTAATVLAAPEPPTVPDGGVTAGLLALGIAALVAIRRGFRNGK